MGGTQYLPNEIVYQSKRVVQYFDTAIAFHTTFNEPLQVIGLCKDQFLVFQIEFIRGRFSAINVINSSNGLSILDDLKVFESLIEQNLDFIIRSWIDYFIYNREPSTEVIEKRLSIN